ncbi:MAG: hypothetical protein KDA85_18840, partial [Planctomycetaceae bacterium]|nr:hypothetical protein [Planctomycetaceae bacterium]
MSQLFFPNLGFEEELCNSHPPSIAAQQRINELAPCLGLLGGPGDAVCVSDAGIPSEIPAALNG